METELMALADALPYPATPDLAAGFWRRLQSQRETHAPASRWSLAGVALAAVVVAAAALIGTVAPARDAAADLFNRINIFRVDENAFEKITREIRGEDVTLAEAEERLGERLDLPAYPDGIENSVTHVVFQDLANQTEPDLGIAHIFFEPSEGAPFVLFATNGRAGKGLAPGAEAEAIDGFGGEAYWLQGKRLVFIYDQAGHVINQSQRVTEANTLIWAHESHVYRIEGELDRDEAIQIARSLGAE